MSLVNFSNLDFDQIKTSIKDYLRSNSNFTDYDFEGSNLSQIIDILAYNTYISSYNANMIANEVFIDSATLRENVVSLARNIGYLPRSRNASSAKINFTVDMTLSQATLEAKTVTLKRGIVSTSSQSFDSETYTFCTLNDVTVPVINGTASFFDVPIYEGAFITQEFIVNPFEPNPPQRYILDNPNIDYNTIKVTVKGGVGDLFQNEYTFSNNLFSIDGNSKVFFLQEIPDQKYELIFGDGVFGKKLEPGNVIDVYYLITNGPDANRISSFTFNGTLIFDSIESNIITNGISLISATEPSSGGKELESVNSIRTYAPQNYSTQNRAVTANDFIALIPKIFPEIESLSVYGGEDLDPPKYGLVYIAVKPKNRNFLSSSARDLLKQRLKKYTVAGIRPEIIDLKFLYIEIDARVYYDTNISSSPQDISTSIVRNITNYSKSSELNNYSSRFKYSKLLKVIDNTSQAITSNITSVRIRRDLRAVLNTFAEYEICFGNQFYVRNQSGYNIRSSGFKIVNSLETVYLSDLPNEDMKTGTIFLFRIGEDGLPVRVKSSAGTIDYVKGEIILSPLNIIETSIVRGENLIEISAIPESNDIIGLNDLYLQLDVNQLKVSLFEDKITSGSDSSGTKYITNSSYQEEDLIRR